MKAGSILTILLVSAWAILEAWDYAIPTASLTFLFGFLFVWYLRVPLKLRSRF